MNKVIYSTRSILRNFRDFHSLSAFRAQKIFQIPRQISHGESQTAYQIVREKKKNMVNPSFAYRGGGKYEIVIGSLFHSSLKSGGALGYQPTKK